MSVFKILEDALKDDDRFNEIDTDGARSGAALINLIKDKIHIENITNIENPYEYLADIVVGFAIYDYAYSLLAGKILAMSIPTDIPYSEKLKLVQSDRNCFTKTFLIHVDYILSSMIDDGRESGASLRDDNSKITYENDLKNYDYTAMKTLMRSYLLRYNGKVIETPNELLKRVQSVLPCSDIYNFLQSKNMIFATPVLFNSAIKNESYSSCFLTSVDDDIDSIFDNIKNCAIISKHCGGISVDINRVRASDSIIKSSGFKTDNSIVKLSKLYNDVSTYINQGGKRNGSIALYIEPWHADIYSFLDLKTNIGDENSKARDIFQALWVPDNFMKAVESDSDYYLMCPSECHFDDKHYYGDKFEEKYNEYVSEGKYRKKIKAKDLWKK